MCRCGRDGLWECKEKLVFHHCCHRCCFSRHCCYCCHQSGSRTQSKWLPWSSVVPRTGPDMSTMWPDHLLGVHAAHQTLWPEPVFTLSVSPLLTCMLHGPIGLDLQHKFKVKVMNFKTVRAEHWTKCRTLEWLHELHVLLPALSLCMEFMLSPYNLRSQCTEIFEP